MSAAVRGTRRTRAGKARCAAGQGGNARGARSFFQTLPDFRHYRQRRPFMSSKSTPGRRKAAAKFVGPRQGEKGLGGWRFTTCLTRFADCFGKSPYSCIPHNARSRLLRRFPLGKRRQVQSSPGVALSEQRVCAATHFSGKKPPSLGISHKPLRNGLQTEVLQTEKPQAFLSLKRREWTCTLNIRWDPAAKNLTSWCSILKAHDGPSACAEKITVETAPLVQRLPESAEACDSSRQEGEGGSAPRLAPRARA